MATRPGMYVGQDELEVRGDMLKVGDSAPNFALTSNNWATKTLKDYAGKVKIFSVMPSLETRVCAAQTRRFNEEAAGLGDDIVILGISSDLPYTQRRWCAAEGVEQVETLSDHKSMGFSDAYGVHVVPLRICQRALFVVDKNNVVQYAEYVPMIGNEVTFSAALEKAKELV
jgi:thiol peroxidase